MQNGQIERLEPEIPGLCDKSVMSLDPEAPVCNGSRIQRSHNAMFTGQPWS
jgi:hypothetical protein